MTQLRDASKPRSMRPSPKRDAPWVLQIYVQDGPRLTQFDARCWPLSVPAVRASDYSALPVGDVGTCRRFPDRVGCLTIPLSPVRVGRASRRIQVVLYRRLPQRQNPAAIEVEEALNDVATKWIASLSLPGSKSSVRWSGVLSMDAELVQSQPTVCR